MPPRDDAGSLAAFGYALNEHDGSFRTIMLERSGYYRGKIRMHLKIRYRPGVPFS
jgi:hypothetical protein